MPLPDSVQNDVVWLYNKFQALLLLLGGFMWPTGKV